MSMQIMKTEWNVGFATITTGMNTVAVCAELAVSIVQIQIALSAHTVMSAELASRKHPISVPIAEPVKIAM